MLRVGSNLMLAAVLIVAMGCGKGAAPETMPKQPTVPASGIIRFNGKAVANATVTLYSLDGKIAPRGTSDSAGIFNLSTYGTNDGAPPGKYKVVAIVSAVTEIAPGVLAPEPPGGFKSIIPKKYSNPGTTDVIVEVKESGKNELTIDLK